MSTADSGLAALEILTRTSCAAVLMDCSMPDIDGLAATAEIRRREGDICRTPVEDGKIRSLVYRSGRMVRGPGGLAGTTSPESAGAVPAALVLLGLGLVSLASVRSHVRSGSNLRGRLISDLGHWTSIPKPSA